MSIIKLDEIVLPDGIWWADEMNWSPMEQSFEYSLAGSLVVDAGQKLAGRPITLTGGEDFAWTTRAIVLALKVKEATPGIELALDYNGREFDVMFDLSGGPAVIATPVVQHSDYDTNAAIYHSLTIKLFEI